MRTDNNDESDRPVLHTPLSVSDLGYAGKVLDWLTGYICVPHPELGRSGPVCPFVTLSMRSDAIGFVMHSEFDGSEPERLTDLLHSYLTKFVDTAPRSPAKRRQRSLVIVLPNIARERYAVLDAIHSDMKSEMVLRGAMLGQFYEGCPQTAARNSDFHVSTGPVPCFAIRHMAPHDVLFLHSRRDWFAEYHRRFAADYRTGKVNDPMMVRLFERAEAKLEKS